jgi:hypothetical protein
MLLTATLAACSPGSNGSADGPSGAAQAGKPAEQPHRPSEQIRLGDLGLVLQPAVVKHQVGLDIAPAVAADGGVLVLIRFSVTNLSAKPVSAANLPEIKLVDDKGTQYAPDAGKTGLYAMASKFDSKLFSDLNPGITVKNAVVFEVSKDSFNPATWVVVTDDQRIALQ